ncbi:hypothetical protein ACFQ8O_27190 [Streptomyces coelicoflavus]|uniref:hypothetical protein n=1 Tax=Streptomyces coelicoflavus TaxID=285562 RepID=UPI00368F970A
MAAGLPRDGRSALRQVALAVAVVALAGCGRHPGVADGAGPRESKTAVSAAPGIRRDEGPVRQRFPELGDVAGVEWTGEVLGSGRSSAPGPTDVRMSGVVRLTDADASRLSEEYVWQDGPGAPVVSSLLRSRVPRSTRWQTSTDFTADVTRGRYSATFHADFGRQVIVFDAVNPERRGD